MLAKTKRNSSNSRSKSKGSKHNARDQSIENNNRNTKPSTMSSNEFKGKVKTEGSLHRHKAALNLNDVKERNQKSKLRIRRGTDKNMLEDSDTHTDRLKSLRKVNKTQAAFDQDLQCKLQQLKTILSNISKPTAQTCHLRQYYLQIQRTLKLATQPLHSLLLFLHNLYTSPLQRLFQIVQPFEALLLKREQLSREVEQQMRENEKLQHVKAFEQENQEIGKLKEMIDKQGRILEQKRDVPERFEKWRRADGGDKDRRREMPRLEIDGLGTKYQAFDDEFRKHLPDFSQSWRQQYLREQRF